MRAGVQTEAIKAIYDAALSGNRWQAALDRMVDASDAMGALIYDMSSVIEPAYSLNTSSKLFHQTGDAIKRYNTMVAEGRGSGFDQEGLGAVHSRPPFRAWPDEDIFDMANGYYQRPEVVWCREEVGFGRRVAMSITDDPIEFRGMIFCYAEGLTEFPPSDLAWIETVGIHAAKAIEIHRLTQPLRAKYQAVLAVLDMIDLPIVLFAPDGTAMLKNRAAADVLSAREALWLDTNGRLAARNTDDTDRLREAVRRMCRTARGEGSERAIELELSRGAGAPPVYAMISPLRDAEMELEAGLDGAFMTLIDTSYPVRPRTDLVAQAYGLTPAEARAAELIACGRTNAEIAERTCTSPETVKTQVKAVFDKTGSHGRLAFLWRVFQFSPPVR